MEKTRLGAALGADYVLLVSLIQFTTREPGSVNLFRGYIVSEASVYQTSLPERHARVWHCPTLRATFPVQGPVGDAGDVSATIRYQVESIFVDRLVRKFHKHEVNEEDEEREKFKESAGSARAEPARLRPDDRLVGRHVRPGAEG
jgi:hypothetical protein